MESYLLPIHFEILDNKHEVSSVTLNTFIEAYKEIFEELFEEKIEIKIGVPEEGCFKVVLKVLGVIGVISGLVGIDNLSILFRGKDAKDIFLTGNKYVTEFISKKAEDAPLEKYPRKCIEQKNKIYQRFQDDKCITSFDLDKFPPIPRNDFNLYIKELPEEYDIIILDPPAFAKHRDKRHKAIQGYKRLNAHAIRQIKPGGLIFTFSCSQVVDKYLFTNTVIAAAIESGRNVRILEQLHQPADHPINAFHPEGEYLKGLVIQVD
jgi:hypothetical protein